MCVFCWALTQYCIMRSIFLSQPLQMELSIAESLWGWYYYYDHVTSEEDKSGGKERPLVIWSSGLAKGLGQGWKDPVFCISSLVQNGAQKRLCIAVVGGREGVNDRIWGVKNTGLNRLGIRVFIWALGLTLPQTWEVMLTSVVLRKYQLFSSGFGFT